VDRPNQACSGPRACFTRASAGEPDRQEAASMDLRDLGRVGLKLFGVWTALESIDWLLGIFQLYVPNDSMEPPR
jgi:hypothetical protein